jgi:hypothetical protein
MRRRLVGLASLAARQTVRHMQPTQMDISEKHAYASRPINLRPQAIHRDNWLETWVFRQQDDNWEGRPVCGFRSSLSLPQTSDCAID